jgi:hypothetical protein
MEHTPPEASPPLGDAVSREPPPPPTAPQAEPSPSRSIEPWTGGRPSAALPPTFVRAVDRVLDVLDELADAVRAAAGRMAG